MGNNIGRNDSILVAAIVSSMTAGVLFPAAGLFVEPYLLVWLGGLLFLNLVKLKPSDLVKTFTKPRQLAMLSCVKLIGLPLAMYGLTLLIYEPFALPVLLLAGISTGLGAPFVVNLIGGKNLPLVVGMIVATSLAVPFILPSMVYALIGSQFNIPFLHMVTLLSAALFTPIGAGWLTNRYLPAASEFADRNSFPLSIIFVILINFGMFAKFSDYFYSDQLFMLQTVATAFLCFAAFSLAGYFSSGKSGRTAGIISMSYINNVLVAVFAFQFFGSQVAALAALYNIPYYAGIVTIKRIADYRAQPVA